MPINPNIAKLFQNTPQSKTITRGSLVLFNYGFYKHDPYPMVIITDDWARVMHTKVLRGVNLHYLTFEYIRKVLQVSKGFNFNYSAVKSNSFLANSYRSYKVMGIRNLRKLDSNFILNTMSIVRNFDPAQIDQIKQMVIQQFNQQINPTANDLIS